MLESSRRARSGAPQGMSAGDTENYVPPGGFRRRTPVVAPLIRRFQKDAASRAVAFNLWQILACAAMFGLLGIMFYLLAGVPFVMPTEQESPAIGAHFLVPVGVTVAGYFVVVALSHVSGRYRRSLGGWARAAAIDGLLIATFILVMYVHFHIKMWMPVINPVMYDAAYYAIDQQARVLIDGATAIRQFVKAMIPGTSIYYGLGLLAMFSLSFFVHASGSRRWHYHNMLALVLVEVVGPLTYLIAPAVGPFIYEKPPSAAVAAAQETMYAKFQHVQADGIAWLVRHGGDYITAPLAAMPSLHIAAASVIAYYIIKTRSVMTPVMLILLGWIIVDSVALRWHYLVDLPAGLALAWLAVWLANRTCRVPV